MDILGKMLITFDSQFFYGHSNEYTYAGFHEM
jgi:hypothetical protein